MVRIGVGKDHPDYPFPKRRPWDVRIVASDGTDLPTALTQEQNETVQYALLVTDRKGKKVHLNPPGVQWFDDNGLFTTNTDGSVFVSPAAPVGVSVTVSAAWKGFQADLEIQVAAGTLPEPGSNTLEKITPGPGTVDPGASIGGMLVELKDVDDNPIAGATINVEISGDGVVEQVAYKTGGLGRSDATAIAPTTAGAHTVTFTSEFGDVAVYSFSVNAPSPSQRVIVLVSGEGQSADPSTQLAADFVVRLEDSTGAPLSGRTIDFTTSDGTLSVSSDVTDANGEASTRYTTGATPGLHTVTASTTDGNGASLQINATCNSTSPGAGEVSLTSLGRQNIGPLPVIDTTGDFANVAQPFQTLFKRYDAAAWEPASWTRFINWENDGFAAYNVIADIQYNGGRMEYALCTGDVIATDATDESDTTVEYWSKMRRMIRQAMVEYYNETKAWWGSTEGYRIVYPHIHTFTELDPTWDQAALVNSNLWQAVAPPNTSDPFGYLLMDPNNTNSGPRLCYQALAAIRNAIMTGIPYKSFGGVGVNLNFSSWLEAWRWLRDRILSSPSINPAGYPPWFLKSPAHNGDPPYMTMLLAGEFLKGDQYIESHQGSRDFAYGVCGRWVDFYNNVLKPAGRTHLPERDFNGVGSMNYQTYHIALAGTYVAPWYMVYQDTGVEKYRTAALEIMTNAINSGWKPFGLNTGKELGESYFGVFQAYAMEEGIPWRL